MPFGLTNAPFSFQYLINIAFKPVLRKLLLVFLDDMLIYCKDMPTHILHLKVVFDIMHHHQLYAKGYKCGFVVPEVEHLGHFISVDGVATGLKKIKVFKSWLIPTTVK